MSDVQFQQEPAEKVRTVDELSERIAEMVEQSPNGIVVVPCQKTVQVLLWQEKAPGEKVLMHNLLTGIAQNVVSKGIMTKAEIIAAIDEVVR